MTKQEMWDLINKEDAIQKENDVNIQNTEENIKVLQEKINVAIKKKDSAAAIKFTDQLESERRKLEIYKEVSLSCGNGVDISKDDFMKCFNEEVSRPYYKRLEELKAELNEKREAYIAEMKKAYRELCDMDNKSREFWDINSQAKLDVNVPVFYPHQAFRDFFINESRYFWGE